MMDTVFAPTPVFQSFSTQIDDEAKQKTGQPTLFTSLPSYIESRWYVNKFPAQVLSIILLNEL